MTSFATSVFAAGVVRELGAALVPVETASIVDHRHLPATCRALLNNALFYVVPTPAIAVAREAAQAAADRLAATIREVGVQPQGISLPVDRARREAVDALEVLIDSVVAAEPTPVARCLGIA